MWQPYIESATALFDYYYYYYIDDKEIGRISGIFRAAEMDFHLLAKPRNVSVDLKYSLFV